MTQALYAHMNKKKRNKPVSEVLRVLSNTDNTNLKEMKKDMNIKGLLK
jgi:hypothetical protein